MNGINILFYSKHCDTCRNLLILLQNENLLSAFKLMCVDEMLDKIPPQITTVPTMFVTNINRPLVAQETFEWIKQTKFIRQQQVMDLNKKIILQNTLNNEQSKKGPVGYDDEMMAGISDKFAFTKIDNPLPHAYFGIGEEDKHVIFTAPKEQQKMSSNDQKKLIKEIEERRTQQDNNYSVLMKQKQMEAVLSAEQEKLLQQNNNFTQNQQQSNQIPMNQQMMLQQQMMQQQMMQQQMMQQQMMQQQRR
jgi:hypothetical protein